jgi:protein-tyrosine-phosphatase
LAEAFVRRLTLGLPVTTESYGTLELTNAAALPEAVEIAHGTGIDIAEHRTRSVHGATLHQIDLVLGFDEAHVREAVVHANARRDRSFTARHFSRLLAALPEATERNIESRARSLVQQADELRHADFPLRAADNMRDPLGAPWKVYQETAVEIRELSLQLVAALFGVTDGRSLPPIPTRSRHRSPLLQRLRLG